MTGEEEAAAEQRIAAETSVSEAGGLGLSVRAPTGAARRRIGLVPADRAEGVLPAQTVQRNLGASNLAAFRRRGVFRRRRERTAALRWIERLDIRPPPPQPVAGTLSGGNQQKILL